MAKRGPTPNCKPDFCPIAYKFCLLGATNDDLAGLFEVYLATIGNWLANIPEAGRTRRGGITDSWAISATGHVITWLT
jgi:hypothetical protein